MTVTGDVAATSSSVKLLRRNIARVERRRGRFLFTQIGAGVGAVLGLIWVRSDPALSVVTESVRLDHYTLALVGIGSAVGAGSGLLLDLLRVSPMEVIYVAVPPPPSQ